jgi:hypothetical protein
MCADPHRAWLHRKAKPEEGRTARGPAAPRALKSKYKSAAMITSDDEAQADEAPADKAPAAPKRKQSAPADKAPAAPKRKQSAPSGGPPAKRRNAVSAPMPLQDSAEIAAVRATGKPDFAPPPREATIQVDRLLDILQTLEQTPTALGPSSVLMVASLAALRDIARSNADKRQ